jgi:hypothetical protein
MHLIRTVKRIVDVEKKNQLLLQFGYFCVEGNEPILIFFAGTLPIYGSPFKKRKLCFCGKFIKITEKYKNSKLD